MRGVDGKASLLRSGRLAVCMAVLCSGLLPAGEVRAEADVRSEATGALAPALAEARRLTVEAEKLYERGEFARARARYRDAYRASPHPELLFNVAQCSRRLGEHDKAISFYGLYLEYRPESPHRSLVESLIAESQRSLSLSPSSRAGRMGIGLEGEAGGGQLGREDGADVDDRRRRRVIAAVSSVVALAVVGSVVAVTQLRRHDESQAPTPTVGVVNWQ